jgi:hypothetical protein
VRWLSAGDNPRSISVDLPHVVAARDRRRGDEPSCDLRGYLLLANRGAVAAADGVPFVQAIPWTVLAVFLVGAADAV